MGYPLLSFSGRVRAAILGVSASLLVAAAGLAAMPAAADPLTSDTHALHGVVQGTPSSGATSFVLLTDRYGKVTVNFAGSTPRSRGRMHGKARSFEVAKASDLKDLERVVVQGHTSADGTSFVARRVHVLPPKDTAGHASHLVGTITGVSSASNGTTLTITPADGATPVTVTVTSDTRIRPQGKTVADLKVTTKVTVIMKNGTATGVVVLGS